METPNNHSHWTAIDLFCGAGGMALGLKQAGFKVIFAADKWKPAVETYSRNFEHEAQQIEIEWNTTLPNADLFVGGPPCQGFSSAGARVPGDSRNSLVAVFAHLVARHKPKAFIFENVEGFLTGDGGRWVLDLFRPLIKAGYAIALRKVNAANYGVPQNRKRVLVVGGLGWFPGLPEPTHRAFGAPGAHLIAKEAGLSPTVADAFFGLPLGSLDQTAQTGDFDHVYRLPNENDKKRFNALKPGQTMRDLPEELWHETFKRRAFRRVKDGTPTERRGGAPAGIRRLDPTQPSKAVTSGAISEFVHPFEDRTLTIRECARLQTFPDTFKFSGKRSDKALLIGNAVPALLAEVMLKHIATGLADREKRISDPGLHEFNPTFSSGMSPALKRTSDLVNVEFGKHNLASPPLQLSLF